MFFLSDYNNFELRIPDKSIPAFEFEVNCYLQASESN